MPRVANTMGTVKERPRRGSGKFYAYLPPSMVPRGGQARIPGVFATKTEARLALNDFMSDLRNNRRVVSMSGHSMTVADAVQAYIDYRSNAKRAQWAARTQEDYRAALRNAIKHPKANIGRISVSRLTPPEVFAWLEDLEEYEVPYSRIQYARWLLSGTIQWLITKGEFVGQNPVGEVKEFWSKSSKRKGKTRLVVIPTWAELAKLIESPDFSQDAALIALMAWSGLRWSEAVALRTTDVWRDRPVLSVSRVFVWVKDRSAEGEEENSSGKKGEWKEEPVKGGVAGRVDLPESLWRQLLVLAEMQEAKGPCKAPFGALLFRGARWTPGGDYEGLIDNRNWTRDVWRDARKAAGLVGDPTRSETEARRNAMQVKDLRAFAASVLVDAGATPLEASVLLRHQDSRTTERHYARAMSVEAHDPDRVSLRTKTDLTLPQRIEALWQLWAKKFPEAAASIDVSRTGKKKRKKGKKAAAEEPVSEPLTLGSRTRRVAPKKAASKKAATKKTAPKAAGKRSAPKAAAAKSPARRAPKKRAGAPAAKVVRKPYKAARGPR